MVRNRFDQGGIKGCVRRESCPGSRCPERDSRRKELGVVIVYRLRKTQPIKNVSILITSNARVLYSRVNSEAGVKE